MLLPAGARPRASHARLGTALDQSASRQQLQNEPRNRDRVLCIFAGVVLQNLRERCAAPASPLRPLSVTGGWVNYLQEGRLRGLHHKLGHTGSVASRRAARFCADLLALEGRIDASGMQHAETGIAPWVRA